MHNKYGYARIVGLKLIVLCFLTSICIQYELSKIIVYYLTNCNKYSLDKQK